MSAAFYAYDQLSEHRFGERFGLDFAFANELEAALKDVRDAL